MGCKYLKGIPPEGFLNSQLHVCMYQFLSSMKKEHSNTWTKIENLFISTCDKKMCIPNKSCGIPDRRCRLNGEIDLILKDTGSEKRTTVFMKLIEECPRHYAVLFKSDDFKFQYGNFNNLCCSADTVPNNKARFKISQIDEKDGLLFEASCSKQADGWINVFRGKFLCPYSSVNRKAYSWDDKNSSGSPKMFKITMLPLE